LLDSFCSIFIFFRFASVSVKYEAKSRLAGLTKEPISGLLGICLSSVWHCLGLHYDLPICAEAPVSLRRRGADATAGN
jgi:hypothetical protein